MMKAEANWDAWKRRMAANLLDHPTDNDRASALRDALQKVHGDSERRVFVVDVFSEEPKQVVFFITTPTGDPEPSGSTFFQTEYEELPDGTFKFGERMLVRRMTRYDPAPATDLAEQVRQELAKPENERVIASVNEAAGTVATYVAPPPPYWEQERAEHQQRPDWSKVDEAGRGLIVSLALAEQREQDTGTDYDKLPSTLSDPEVVDSWKRSDAWRRWIATPPETRRAYVRAVLSDLKQVSR